MSHFNLERNVMMNNVYAEHNVHTHHSYMYGTYIHTFPAVSPHHTEKIIQVQTTKN